MRSNSDLQLRRSPVGAVRRPHSSQSGDVSRKTILIVEDNYDNRAIYAAILGRAGYHVVEGRNGVEGVGLAIEHRPDLIIMDLSMPLLDGWGAIAALRDDARTASIPVLALSAHVVLDGDYRRSQEAGFAAYLTKPIEPKDVLHEIVSRIGPARPEPMVEQEG
ncbi:MAG: response regulator [Gemmatimonas sp.]|nr:response regulator [Gemmatimonas sp.]